MIYDFQRGHQQLTLSAAPQAQARKARSTTHLRCQTSVLEPDETWLWAEHYTLWTFRVERTFLCVVPMPRDAWTVAQSTTEDCHHAKKVTGKSHGGNVTLDRVLLAIVKEFKEISWKSFSTPCLPKANQGIPLEIIQDTIHILPFQKEIKETIWTSFRASCTD